MADSYFAAVAVLALLTLLPGPDLAVVSRAAFSHGRRAALHTAAGVVSGLVVWGLLVAAGLAAVLAASPVAYTVVRLSGAAYLVVMGVRALWQSRRSEDQSGPQVPDVPASAAAARGAWRTGMLTNLLNPKVAIFYTSLLPSLVPRGGSPALWLPALVATHVLLSLTWLAGCAVALSGSRSVLSRPRARRWLTRVTGTALIGFGLRVAAAAR